MKKLKVDVVINEGGDVLLTFLRNRYPEIEWNGVYNVNRGTTSATESVEGSTKGETGSES